MYFSSIAHKMILIPLDPPFQPTVGDVGAGGGYVIFIPNRPQTSGGEIIFEIKGVTGGERGGGPDPPTPKSPMSETDIMSVSLRRRQLKRTLSLDIQSMLVLT